MKENSKKVVSKEVKKQSSNWLVFVALIGLLGAVFLLFNFNSSTVSNSIVPSASKTSINAVSSQATASINVDAAWVQITNQGVEKACFSQAKREAAAQGYSESLVFGCSCTEQASAETKSYDCKVSALDGSHPVSVVCIKSKQVCEVNSEQGKIVYSFNELNQFK
ncbi:hypothetical protein HUU53_03165 [Candidatus Micrarchaeota archaeon]|nr:hypothetical protein [Candidatus Micrarchaeota archaeon]